MKQNTTARQIPFFNRPALRAEQETDFMDVNRDVGIRSAYIMQRNLEYSENNMSRYNGMKYASGRSRSYEFTPY